MATIANLEERGDLQRIECELVRGVQPHRMLYGIQRFVHWLDGTLPGLGRKWHGRLSPEEQTFELVRCYICGEKLRYRNDLHELFPLDKDIWELKTADIRIFGWFVKKDIFVAVSSADATFVEEKELYHGLVREVEYHRTQLDLDEPKKLTEQTMTKSYQMRLDSQRAQQIRVISDVRHELLRAFDEESATEGLTQQAMAERLGVNKSVISKRLGGEVNLTLRSIADLLWSMGREFKFTAAKSGKMARTNEPSPTTFTKFTAPTAQTSPDIETDVNKIVIIGPS